MSPPSEPGARSERSPHPVSAPRDPPARRVAAAVRAIRTFLVFEQRRGVLLLSAILAVLAVDKLSVSLHTTSTFVDGGFYTDIARNLRDGHGLTTSISLLHKGYSYFPHPTSVYPLWPLLYGGVAHFMPLLQVGIWLPTILYFVSLILAYVWGSRLFPEPLFPMAIAGFNAGHVLVLLLGLNFAFFQMTSFPYTEGLAFALLFGMLIRFHSLLSSPSLKSGAEVGIWLGVLVLCRTQLLTAALAAFPTLLLATLAIRGARRAYAVMGLAALGAFCLVQLPHYLYLRTFIEGASPLDMLRFDQVRFTNVLTPVETIGERPGLGPFFESLKEGLAVAFEYDSSKSYANTFYTVQYGLFLAVPLWILTGIRELRSGVRTAFERLARPETVPLLFVAVLAAGSFAAIHVMQKTMSGSAWYFHRRHALYAVLLFFLALASLLHSRRFPWRAWATLILCSSVWLGAHRVHSYARAQSDRVAGPYRPALVRWLNEQRRRDEELIVAMRQPQVIAWLTPGVGYHWYYERTTLDDVKAMVTRLGVDYLVLERRASFERPARLFRGAFEYVGRKSNARIFRPTKTLLAKRRRVTEFSSAEDR